jgi:hypothetical protein
MEFCGGRKSLDLATRMTRSHHLMILYKDARESGM